MMNSNLRFTAGYIAKQRIKKELKTKHETIIQHCLPITRTGMHAG